MMKISSLKKVDTCMTFKQFSWSISIHISNPYFQYLPIISPWSALSKFVLINLILPVYFLFNFINPIFRTVEAPDVDTTLSAAKWEPKQDYKY